MPIRSVRSLALLSLAACCPLAATETENLGLRVLPAPGPVVVDGAFGDWDLAGGIFGCGDVENQRDKFGFWAHAAYDVDNLYVLVRFVDPTPLNNPGQVEGDYGFAGDSLQFRIVVGGDGALDKGRGSHWTCWQGRDGKHVMDVAYGVRFDQGALKDAQVKGAKQAFKVFPDRSGYAQELAIPWGLVAPDGWKPTAGERLRLTFEPNFTVGASGRLSAKDLFAPDLQLDRVFTFMNPPCWGFATLAKPGQKPGTVVPQPLRLSDRREFAVSLKDGAPVIDWTGLIKQKELAGHKTIAFDMPFDGYISLNLFAADGTVARQLLNTAFYTKGRHEVKWDGLTTFSWRNPGEPVPAGEYTWRALVHPGFDLRLVGWAANAGSAPWDGPTGKDNWGGDHGVPVAAGSAGDTVLLGWSGAEAGKALVATDAAGAVKWKHSRNGMSGMSDVATDGTYVFGATPESTYRLKLADGSYAPWPGRDSPDLAPHDVLDEAQRKTIPNKVTGIAARDGDLYLAAGDTVLVIDAVSGALKKTIAAPATVALAAPATVALAAGANALYAITDHQQVVAIDVAAGTAKPFASVADAWGVAVAADGTVYVSVRGARQQVVAFDAAGKELRAIGRSGGRPATGPWDASGLREPRGITVDPKGQLWVTEEGFNPKRISVWNAADGAFVRELFGPTVYGALGGSISPKDPLIMAGQGSEWRLDPKTGKATCLAVVDDAGFNNSRFAIGANGREYLVTAANWAFDAGPVKVFEHLAPGKWKLRARIDQVAPDGQVIDPSGHTFTGEASKLKPEEITTRVWADKNDNGTVDGDEIVSERKGQIRFSGWYMMITPDLTLYGAGNQFRTTGFTACGAPTWDLNAPVKLPVGNGLGSADGTLLLAGGDYGAAHTAFRCFDIASGKVRWSYPDNFVGVHGSHNAPPPEVGMIRGSYDVAAAVKLPAPVGNAWIIPTNVGEWHILTEGGFYLGRLFQGDPIKVVFPEQAVPGALMNEAPCGMGGEDFGGSATLAQDGRLYLQAGKTGFWNIAVDHLDQVRELKGSGTITIAPGDIALARGFKERAQQEAVGLQRLAVKKATPAFTGNIEQDFAGARIVSFDKGEGTRVRSALAWDEGHLHVAWEVQDRSPWTNGAHAGDEMYWGGDSVDLQLATDAGAPSGRTEAAKGDLRLSIGTVAGKETVTLFRKVAEQKHPRTFSSGVIKAYAMDSVVDVPEAKVTVTRRADGYTVEASIPAAALGLAPAAGLKLKGDVGVTFGNQAGDRTRLRSYWSNQHTGIVDDVVFELQMEPQYWGELILE